MATVQVVGLAELRRACRVAANGMASDINDALKSAGEPVKQDAQTIATSILKPSKIPWSTMRLGIAKNVVYIVPATKRTVGTRRENMKAKLLDEAMVPALVRNTDKVAQEFHDAVRDMGRLWARV